MQETTPNVGEIWERYGKRRRILSVTETAGGAVVKWVRASGSGISVREVPLQRWRDWAIDARLVGTLAPAKGGAE